MTEEEINTTKYNEAILKLLKENISLIGMVYSYYKSKDFTMMQGDYDQNGKYNIITPKNKAKFKICPHQKFMINACSFHYSSPDQYCFLVDEKNKLYYCYGCGSCGSQFDFLQYQYNISLDSATRILSRILGYNLDRLSEEEEKIYNEVGSYYYEYENLIQKSNIKTIELYNRINNYIDLKQKNNQTFDIYKIPDRLCCDMMDVIKVLEGRNDKKENIDKKSYCKRKAAESNPLTNIDDAFDLPF